ncbi:MAG: hypothetical protein JRJ03_15045 [Deltaproteobacteria bacterium]|nr:hypothetical protein [Deltaproteobacteria bacterium]
MSQDDITQVKVGGTPVGIIGLEAALEEVAEDCGNSSDEEIQEQLLRSR